MEIYSDVYTLYCSHKMLLIATGPLSKTENLLSTAVPKYVCEHALQPVGLQLNNATGTLEALAPKFLEAPRAHALEL